MQSELHLGKEEEPQVTRCEKPSSQGEEHVQRGGCMEELENGVYQELEPKNSGGPDRDQIVPYIWKFEITVL